MKKVVSIGLGVALLGLAIYFLFLRGDVQQAAEQGHAGVQSQALKAIKVTAQALKSVEELPGRVTAYKVAEIRPQVTGIITERLFTEGGEVEEGQQLYQIDPAPYQAAYDSAKANIQKALANVKSTKARSKRYEELVKIDAVSKQEYEDIQATLAQANADIAIAKAAAAQAKINLDYTKVYAPISGVIGKSTVTKGALVTAGQSAALSTITQLDPVYIDMTQSSEDLIRLRGSTQNYEDIPVSLYLGEGGGKYPHEGKLQFHEVTVEQTTGSVQLRALFPNPEKLLLPGLFVRARLAVEIANAITVPQYATTRQSDGNLSAWKLGEDGTVQQATIVTNGAVDGKWIVSEGLQAGDVIITEGLIGLRPGMNVSPVFENEVVAEPKKLGEEE